jgi:CRISPR-associated protein Cmr6
MVFNRIFVDKFDFKKNLEKLNYGLYFYKYLTLNKNDNKIKAESVNLPDFKKINSSLIHLEQIKFCKSLEEHYHFLTFYAKLKTPLITGIGYPHISEVGMTFDHTTGLPYMPASSIKGLTRFYSDLKNENIVFGSTEKKGEVIFLDAFPYNNIELKKDILTPHFNNEDENIFKYTSPNPIQFLCVKEGCSFIFRFLVSKQKENLLEEIKNAYKEILLNEGIGAKTSVGYGFFEEIEEQEPKILLKEYQKSIQEELTPEKKLEIRISKISNFNGNEQKQEVSNVYLDLVSNNYSKHFFVLFKNKLKEINDWKPSGSSQRKEKTKKRNEVIDKKINE